MSKALAAVAVGIAFLGTVTLNAATTLEVALPATVTAQSAFQFTVTARNGSLIDPSYAGTIHFASSDPSATLPVDYTFNPADAGSHTFAATFPMAGPMEATANHTITATDLATPAITGTDVTTVRWAADVVRRFGMTCPEQVTRTVEFHCTVSAWNADHQVVPGYQGTVHFWSILGGIVIPADYTYTPADQGVHTFSFTAAHGGTAHIDMYDVSDTGIFGSSGFYVVCPELSVTASNNGPVCPNTPVVLYATSNQDGVIYEWSGPALFMSREQNPTAMRTGYYHVSVLNSLNCLASAYTVVEAKPVLQPVISAPSSPMCGREPFTVTLTNAALFSDVAWRVDNGTLLNGQGSATIEVAPAATADRVEIWLSAKDIGSGCLIDRGVAWFTIYGGAQADITTPATACPGSTQTASVPPNVPGATTFHWTITNGSIIGGQGTSTIQYRVDTGEVTLATEVSQLNGCRDTDTATVSAVGPTAQVAGEFAICRGEEIAIPVVVTGKPPFTITWSDGIVQENLNGTSVTRFVAPLASSIYGITSVSDADCKGDASGNVTISVDEPPEILRHPQDVVIPSGRSATLSVAVTGATSFDWYQGPSGDRSHRVASGPSSTFTTPILTSTTSYWVEVHSRCGSLASNASTVTVHAGSRRRSVRH